MVEKDKIFEVKELFDYLKNLKEPLFYKPSATAPGIYLHKHNENDQAVIDDFDILVFVEEKLPKKFEYKNYIGLMSDSRAVEKREITTFEGLYKLINEVFYSGKLNLYGDVNSKLPKDFQNLIYLTRGLAKNILKRDIDSLFGYLRFGDSFITHYIRENKIFKAGEVLNLILSIKAYKGENVDIKGTLGKIEEKVMNLEELSKDEWHILAGQIIKYLLDKSKKSDKKADMIEPFLRAGRVKKLKQEIEMLYFNYKHEIPLNFKKLNNAIVLIMAKEGNEKVDKEKLLIGLLSENIFYKKDEK
jgi:CRISPR-associated protein Csh1